MEKENSSLIRKVLLDYHLFVNSWSNIHTTPIRGCSFTSSRCQNKQTDFDFFVFSKTLCKLHLVHQFLSCKCNSFINHLPTTYFTVVVLTLKTGITTLPTLANWIFFKAWLPRTCAFSSCFLLSLSASLCSSSKRLPSSSAAKWASGWQSINSLVYEVLWSFKADVTVNKWIILQQNHFKNDIQCHMNILECLCYKQDQAHFLSLAKTRIYIFHKFRCQSFPVSSCTRNNHLYYLFVTAEWLFFLQYIAKWIRWSTSQIEYFCAHGFVLNKGKKTLKYFQSHLGNQKQSAIFKEEKSY